MTWFRVDDGSDFHEKVVQAGNEAWGALCRGGAWSSRQKTDGFLPDHIAGLIAPEKVWRKLEAAKGSRGLRGLVERGTGGWQIHDFCQWNPTAEEVDRQRQELSEKRRKAGLAGSAKRWDGHSKPMASAIASAMAKGSQTDRACQDRDLAPDPSRPLRSDPSDLVPAVAVPPAPQQESDPDSPPPPPVLTAPEPKPPKRKPKQQPLAVKVATGVGWKLWRSLYPQSKRNYGRYVDAPEDGPEMKRIVNTATDHAIGELRERGTPGDPVEPIVQAILEHWFKEYLRDDGGERGWIAEQRHPLRYVLKGITKYGTPWSRSRAGGSSGLPQEALQAREALHKSAEVRFGT